MAAAPLIAMGVGSAVQAVGAIRAGNAAGDAAEANARSAVDNAIISTQQAAEEERRVRVMGAKQLGDIRASYAASGVQMEGSALDVLSESAKNAEMDALTARYRGEVRARGFENEASLENQKSSYARTQGYLSAAGTLISGAGSTFASRK